MREIAGVQDLVASLAPASLSHCRPLFRERRPFIIGALGNSITFGADLRSANHTWLSVLHAKHLQQHKVRVVNGAVCALAEELPHQVCACNCG